MKILVTNDDGITTEGLRILVEEASKLGDVLVVSPKTEQSGKSHSINVYSGFTITKEENLFPGIPAYSVDSTPADCVRYAYYGLKYDFDVVFSGINNGYNLGDDILYSGTVAAASEAVFCGRKGIAFSAPKGTIHEVRASLQTAIRYVFENSLLTKGDLYNINFSPTARKVAITHQGKAYYNTRFDLDDDNLYYQRGKFYFDESNNNINGDVNAVSKDLISITPLLIDRTNFELYNKLSNHKK